VGGKKPSRESRVPFGDRGKLPEEVGEVKGGSEIWVVAEIRQRGEESWNPNWK